MTTRKKHAKKQTLQSFQLSVLSYNVMVFSQEIPGDLMAIIFS